MLSLGRESLRVAVSLNICRYDRLLAVLQTSHVRYNRQSACGHVFGYSGLQHFDLWILLLRSYSNVRTLS